MSSISMFYGVIIYMCKDDYASPHVRVKYQEYEACYDFDSNLIKGDLPIKQKKLVEAWIAIHEDELKANWELLQSGDEICRIDPLK